MKARVLPEPVGARPEMFAASKRVGQREPLLDGEGGGDAALFRARRSRPRARRGRRRWGHEDSS